MDYYHILGVDQFATDGQIKNAYRRLVKVYHPDINPSAEAELKIREITIAYEVLSDPSTRSIYDLQRNFGSQNYQQVHREPTPEEIYRQEYRKKRAKEEQQRLEYLWRLKIRFYGIQRIFCYAFVLVSIVFSIDYFFTGNQMTDVVKSVRLRETKGDFITEVSANSFLFSTSSDFYDHFDQKRKPYIQVYYSSIFEIPSKVGFMVDSEIKTFEIYDTLHTYGNFFSYILLLLSGVIIMKKRYADWALTLAILPFFIVAFLFLSVLPM